MILIKFIPAAIAIFLSIFAADAYSGVCPPEFAKQPKGEPIQYQLEDGHLIRVDQDKKTRQAVKGLPGTVKSFAHSVLNCDGRLQMQTDANFMAVVLDDGSVWVRAKLWLWYYGFSPASAAFLDTKGKWKKLTTVRDAVSVAAGESWAAILLADGRVLKWGFHGNTSAPTTWLEDRGRSYFEQRPLQASGYAKMTAVWAFNEAIYMVDIDGHLWIVGASYLCPTPEKLFPHAYPSCEAFKGLLGEITSFEMQGKFTKQCIATTKSGQKYKWPCDDADTDNNARSVIEPALVE